MEPVRLHEDDRAILLRLVFLLEDPNVGLCRTVKEDHEAIHGNGRTGIKTQVIVIYCILFVLALAIGADNPYVIKFLAKILI